MNNAEIFGWLRGTLLSLVLVAGHGGAETRSSVPDGSRSTQQHSETATPGGSITVHETVQQHRRAAAQGDVDAQNSLGLLYYTGKGVRRDHSEAKRWFQQAADQGHADAQNNIGMMHTHEKGGRRD